MRVFKFILLSHDLPGDSSLFSFREESQGRAPLVGAHPHLWALTRAIQSEGTVKVPPATAPGRAFTQVDAGDFLGAFPPGELDQAVLAGDVDGRGLGIETRR